MCDALFARMRTLLLTALLFAVPVLADESIFPSKEQQKAARQLEADTLSDANKAFLKGKMKHHNKDMKELSIAVATLKASEVQRLAQGVANAPRLDPNMGESSQLPKRFFELQEELKKNANALVEAGKANDMNAMLGEYQKLVTTCASCHATFRAQIADKK